MANHIKKAVEEIDQSQSRLEKGLKKLQYSCDHQRRPMIPALKKITDNKHPDANGNPVSCYKCEKCRALISEKAPTDDEADEAFATLETMSNYMRLQIDSTTEKGKDKLAWHAEFMMKANELFKSYKSIRKAADKKSKNKDKSDGRHGGAFYEG